MNVNILSFRENNFPAAFVCSQYGGKDLSPEISWEKVPNAKSYALICHDPDAPSPGGWVHWVIQKIPSSITTIPKMKPVKKRSFILKKGTIVQGINSWGRYSYGGPCPPKDKKDHRYCYHIYALNTEINYGLTCTKQQHDCSGPTRETLLKLMDGHIINHGMVMKQYQAL